MATEQTTERSAEQLVRDYFAAIARRDRGAFEQFLSREAIEEVPGVGVLRGPVEVREFFTGLWGAIPDIETVVDRTVSEGGAVVVQWRMSGNFTGSPLFNGVEATGGFVQIRGCDVIEVEDGAIVRNTVYQDTMEMARTIGMMPPQHSPPERAMVAAFNALTKVRRAIRDRVGK